MRQRFFPLIVSVEFPLLYILNSNQNNFVEVLNLFVIITYIYNKLNKHVSMPVIWLSVLAECEILLPESSNYSAQSTAGMLMLIYEQHGSHKVNSHCPFSSPFRNCLGVWMETYRSHFPLC